MRVAQNRGLLSGLFRGFGKRGCHPATACSGAAPGPRGKARPIRGWLGAGAVLLGLIGCGVEGRDHLLRGQRLLQEGRPAEAIEPLLAAARAFQTNAPAAAQVWNYLGLAYQRSGRPAEAARAYKAALDRDLNLFDARFNLGALFFEQGNFTAAINELTAYTAHQARDPAGWLLLGRAQLRAGLLDAADRHLLQALRLNPTPLQQAAALNALGLGQAQRRRAREAFQYFEAALNRVTNYPPALLNQAVLSHQLQDRNFALQKYAAYLAVAGHAPDADAIRALTNRLAEHMTLALKPTPPAESAPVPLALTNGRTAAPPVAALVRTAAPPPQPAVVSPPGVTAPPATAQTTATTPTPTSPPPATAKVAVTPAPPSATTSAPPRAVSPAPHVASAATPSAPPPPATAPSPALTPGTAPTPAASAPEAAAKPPARSVETPTAPAEPTVAKSGPTETAPSVPRPETVQLEPEPEIKPAVDVALAPPTVPSAQPAAPPATPAEAPALQADKDPRAPASPPESSPGPEPELPRKRSFLARLNPLNLIRGEDTEEKARERQAREAAEQARKAEKQARKQTARTPPTPGDQKPASRAGPAQTAAPPRPVFPRYAYARPTPPPPGNRAEAERLVAEGVTAHQAGRLADALAAYTRAVQADPAHFPARFNLAVAAFEARDWSRALSAYEAALALAPDDANARYGFALTLEHAGYPLDAAAELEKLLTRDPGHVEAHLALANLCATTLDDRSRARTHYLKVLQLQPNHPQAGLIKRWLGPAYRPGGTP